MGSGAHVVIVEDGQWQNYGTSRLGFNFEHMLILGPAIAATTVQWYSPLDRDGWLPLRICEAAALIDRDRSDLLVWQHDWLLAQDTAGLPDVPVAASREVLLRGLRRTWPGWTVRWAPGGLLDVAAEIGLDPAFIEADAGGGPPPASDAAPSREELQQAHARMLRWVDRDWAGWTVEQLPARLERMRMTVEEARELVGPRIDAGLTDVEYARLRSLLAA